MNSRCATLMSSIPSSLATGLLACELFDCLRLARCSSRSTKQVNRPSTKVKRGAETDGHVSGLCSLFNGAQCGLAEVLLMGPSSLPVDCLVATHKWPRSSQGNGSGCRALQAALYNGGSAAEPL